MAHSKFDGSWQLTEKDGKNFEKYLVPLGISYLNRKIATKFNRKITIKSTGENSFHMKTESTLKANEKTVNFGETVSEKRDDGVPIVVRFSYEEGCIVQVQKFEVGKEKKCSTNVWKNLDDDRLEFKLSCDGCECNQIYVRI